ncbi:hypothetical protein AB0F71_38615 [Kitasatospora sp. NPDC028055]|uniref:hypothetical protein n=1 Tax=Kitasatospora sp. NPDC028055 TaxID=3155653 RepID=UPI0033D16840
MHPTTFDGPGELTTQRLVLRTWTAAEAAAVVTGTSRPASWAPDFPAEGDRVIVGLLDDNPAWLSVWGHRLIIERASGLVIGSIGLFWPPATASWNLEGDRVDHLPVVTPASTPLRRPVREQRLDSPPLHIC